MFPSDDRMLVAARRAVLELSENASAGDKATLDSIDAVLVEFLLREDRAFYLAHYALAKELAEQGESLTKAYNLNQQQLTSQVEQLPCLENSAFSARETWQPIDQVRDLLKQLVMVLAVPGVEKKPDVVAYLDSLVDWENQFHARHSEFTAAEQQQQLEQLPDYFTRQNLESYLAQKFPEWGELKVSEVKVLPGGFSKKTVLFNVEDTVNGKRSLVIRAEQPPRFDFWEGDQVKNEFVILQLVYEAGLPVPEPLWLEEDRQFLGQPFLVSMKGEGQNVGTAMGASSGIANTLLENLIAKLVAIHNTRLNLDDERVRQSHIFPWAQNRTLKENTAAWVEHWSSAIDRKMLRPSPLMTRILTWLRNNVPNCDEPPSLLHGDFGLHNVLVSDNKVSCILDWEYLTFGDPAEDIALLYLSMSGQVSKQEIMTLYQQLGGKPISEYRLRYFDVMYALKFILPCENALNLFQYNVQANLNLCRFAFHYTYAGVATVNEKIALAEQARAAEASRHKQTLLAGTISRHD